MFAVVKMARIFLALCTFATLLVAQTTNSPAPAEQPVAAPEPSGPKPLATLEVGSRTYSNVTLKSSNADYATITHDAGIKNIPLSEMTLDQMKALNATTTLASIDMTKVDPNPPSQEVFKQLDRWIVSAGGINRRLENGNTPLIEAVLTGQTDFVKAALKKRADVNAVNREGRTAWREAAVRGYSEIAAMLEAAGAKVPNLFASARTGDLETVELYLAKDPKSLEAKTEEGSTLLMAAARNGHDKVVEALVAKGAALEDRDNEGRTPILLAAEGGKADIVRYLATKGADVNARDKAGQTSLMKASQSGSLEVMKALLDHGANVRITDREQGWTALMHAVRKSKLEAVELLLEKGARPDSVDRNGDSALDIAQRYDMTQMQERLLEARESAGKAKTDKQKSFKRVQGSELAVLGEKDVKKRTLPRYVPFLMWSGLALAAVGHVWLTVVAIHDGLIWGLAVLFLNPLGGAAYCFGRVRGAIPIFAIYLVGCLLVGVPAWLFDVNVFEFFL
jgi:ankyrin repeat protein